MTAGEPVSAPDIPGEFSDIPYAGLFGDSVIARVLEEIIADPHSVYHPKDLEDLTGCSAPRVRDALVTLTRYGLLRSSGGKHPAYVVDMQKKTFIALTLLAYAVLDDTRDTGCMDTAIRHYCETRLQVLPEPCVVTVPAPARGFPAAPLQAAKRLGGADISRKAGGSGDHTKERKKSFRNKSVQQVGKEILKLQKSR